MTARKLRLERETLPALGSDDLHDVAGAASGTSCGGSCVDPRCHVVIAPSLLYTCIASLCPCPTH